MSNVSENQNSATADLDQKIEIPELDWENDPHLQDPDAPRKVVSPFASKPPEFEQMVAGNTIFNEDLLILNSRFLPPDAFSDKGHQVALEIAYDYYKQHNSLCPKHILYLLAEEKLKNDKKTYPTAMTSIRQLEYLPIGDLSFWTHSSVEMAKSYVILKAIETFQKTEDYKVLAKAYADAAAIVPDIDKEHLFLDDMDELEDDEWIVDQHFMVNDTTVIFGPSNAGKTFFCLDIAMTISSGINLLNRWPVKQGKVLYICAEGRKAIKKRCKAWLAGHPEVSKDTIGKNICFLPQRYNFCDRATVDRLINKYTKILGQIDVLFIDTLTRNFDGDPDKNAEMMKYVEMVDHFREQTGAAVVTIHHTGHSATDRERGAKALRDACDNSILVTSGGDEDIIDVVCKKQREAEFFEPYKIRKMKVDRALCLELVGTASEIQRQEREERKQTDLDILLDIIPVIGPDEEPTEQNTLTRTEIQEKTRVLSAENRAWSTGKISPLITQLCEDQKIHSIKIGGNGRNIPDRFYRRDYLLPR